MKLGCLIVMALMASHAAAQSFWTHFARNHARDSLVDRQGSTPVNIATPLWIASLDNASRAIMFNGQSGPVVGRDRVYALGRSGGISRAFAFRRADGLCVWSAPVANPVTDSWSSPAIDENGGSLIVGAGNKVTALDLRTGATRWSATLARNIVNASPLVTPTVPRRVFITDADAFGGSGRLYCINADRFDAVINPFNPGHVIWSAIIGGSSGNTPAYSDGRILVATVGEFGFTGGSIIAFDAAATAQPSPVWTFENPASNGFFGGVTIRDGAVYAASYAFTGGQTAANLVKLDASNGELIWDAPCNRTDAVPIAIGGGLVVVSGGLAGFGASPSIQLFQDIGADATLTWDSAIATWSDSNGNGLRDSGEYLSIGGWTHQPVALSHGTSMRLLVGTLPSGTSTATPCTHLRVIDLSVAPGSSSFVVSAFAGAGSTPAAVGPSIYTIGASGLHAFGPRFDVNADGVIDIEDLYAWEGAAPVPGSRDVDRDGDVDSDDRAALLEELRRDELADMTGPIGVGGRR